MALPFSAIDLPTPPATDRLGAMRLPFALQGPLARRRWADRDLWNLRVVADPGGAEARPGQLERAARQQWILVTSDPEYLDDRLFPPMHCAGVIVVGGGWERRLDGFLTAVVGLVGPVLALYRGVKVHGGPSLTVTVTAPAGRSRRVTRRFLPDQSGMPTLIELRTTDGRIYGFPGYRRAAPRPRVLA